MGPARPALALQRPQTDVGKMAVVGFFVLSGFMITGSGARITAGRFAWHRALRILPGLWGSLLLSALVIIPALYYWLHGSLNGYWNHPQGPRVPLRHLDHLDQQRLGRIRGRSPRARPAAPTSTGASTAPCGR